VIKEFREFITRGNVVDLAVAVIIGGAFGLVVTSFTNDVLMQIISAIVGEPDFSNLSFDISDTPIYYGAFLTALVNFLIIALALFLVVKAINQLQELAQRTSSRKSPRPPRSTCSPRSATSSAAATLPDCSAPDATMPPGAPGASNQVTGGISRTAG
jgi:large conductance mechanosensitive channel